MRTALLALCAIGLAGVTPAAQAQSSLGWVATLGGSCWQGVDAAGAPVDRQCFQVQFSRFLRGAITRPDGFAGSSVLGYNATRHRLEMYAWGNNGAEPAIYTPGYDGAALAFSDADGRVVWRSVDANTYAVVKQTRAGGAWTDHSVVTYRRDGDAPAAFAASAANSNSHPAGGFGWLDAQAGHCFHQIEPHRVPANRGCLVWEYPTVLHQTWYWSSPSPTGEMVMFRMRGGDIKFFSWDASGNFGIGDSSWGGDALYSTTDASSSRRTVLRHTTGGFSTTTEIRDKDSAGWPWVARPTIRLYAEH